MLIVSDGKILKNAVDSLKADEAMINGILKRAGRRMEDVLLMTADSSGKVYIAWKNGGEPFTEGQ